MLLIIGLVRHSNSKKRDLENNPQLIEAKIEDGRAFPRPRGRATEGTKSIIAGTILTAISGGVIGFLVYLLRDGLTKGRLLRIRNRATLPVRQTGQGWHDNTSVDVEGLTTLERATIGEAWHLAARMEHASVPAFAQLSLHLAALGAPARLLRESHLAAIDEITHAQHCFAIARQISGQPWTAGSIPELGARESGPVTLEALAIGSLVDGCLGEGIAARIAASSAELVSDPAIREVLSKIAVDERRHAELGWSVLAWCLRGSTATLQAVSERIRRLDDEITPSMPELPGVPAERLAEFGIPPQAMVETLALAELQSVKERAQALVTGPAQHAAAA